MPRGLKDHLAQYLGPREGQGLVQGHMAEPGVQAQYGFLHQASREDTLRAKDSGRDQSRDSFLKDGRVEPGLEGAVGWPAWLKETLSLVDVLSHVCEILIKRDCSPAAWLTLNEQEMASFHPWRSAFKRLHFLCH